MLTINADDLNRFMRCNGSRLMATSPVAMSADTSARDEGTAAHYMAVATFTNQFKINELVDRKAPNGVYMSSEMAEFVSEYLHAIVNRYVMFAEMEVDTSFSGLSFAVNGRADHISVSSDGSTLCVDDFKYGWGIVEPELNWTLISHAVGFCSLRGIRPTEFVFTIHQPRPYHPDGKVREWRVSEKEFTDLHSQLINALMHPSDTISTGEHCHKCPSLANCPAAQKASMNAVDVSEMAFNDEIDNVALSQELDVLHHAERAITNRLKACEELAKHRVKTGAVVENYSLEPTISNRNWKKGITPEFIASVTGVDISEKSMLSPAKAEKLINPEIVKTFTERFDTGIKLIRVKANKKAKRIFGEK